MFEKGDLWQQQRTQGVDNVMVPNKLAKQRRWKHGALLLGVEPKAKRKPAEEAKEIEFVPEQKPKRKPKKSKTDPEPVVPQVRTPSNSNVKSNVAGSGFCTKKQERVQSQEQGR